MANEEAYDQLAVIDEKSIQCKEFPNNQGSTTRHCTSDSGTTDYHAILFSRGDRYDPETGKVIEDSNDRWVNIACKGTAPYKMHLAGYTSAATRVAHERGFVQITNGSLAEKQAMFHAFRAKYFVDKDLFTVPGQPLFVDSSRLGYGALRFQDWSRYHDEWQSAGKYEAIWDQNGVMGLHHPRRSSALLHESPPRFAISFINSIRPGFEQWENDWLLNEHKRMQGATNVHAITYVPKSCRVIDGNGEVSCVDPDSMGGFHTYGCYCDAACTTHQDCCYDYDPLLCKSMPNDTGGSNSDPIEPIHPDPCVELPELCESWPEVYPEEEIWPEEPWTEVEVEP